MNDARLAVPVGIAWAALAIAIGDEGMLVAGMRIAGGIAIASVIAAALLGGRARLRRLLATAAVAAACSTLLLSAGAASEAARGAVDLAGCPELEVRLDGRALDSPLLVTVVSASCADGIVEASESAVVLEGPQLPADAAPGSTWRLTCDAWRAEPGGTSTWMLSCDGADASGADDTIVAEPPERLDPGGELLTGVGVMREAFHDVAARLPGDGAALLTGLSIGDTSRVPPDLEQSMLVASLSHLTAVSGANCAIVVGAVFGIAVMLGAGRTTRVVLAGVALAAFCVLVTFEPSVVRASAMAVIGLIGLWLGRRGSGVSLIALAVLVLLVIDPHLARSVGFALSTLATAGLIVHARPLAVALARVLPTPLAVAIAVPLAAQLWCTPVLVTLDASVSPLGILANLMAGPAAAPVTVLGLVACLLAPVVPAVALGVAALAWPFAAWIAGVARVVAAMPAIRIDWPAGVIGVVAAVGVVALVVVGVARGRPGRGLVAALVACALVAACVQAPAMIARATLGDWRVAQCDVGQGDATLVRADGGVVLVDTGIDDRLIARCLDLFGVDRIALLVLTHFDADHVGAAGSLAGRVDAVWHGPPDAQADDLLARLASHGAAVRQVWAGDAATLQAGGDGVRDLAMRVLWPPERGTPEPGNDASVVVAFDGILSTIGGDADLVALGDLGAPMQRRLLRDGVPRTSAVVVAHHGSKDQLPELYEHLQAGVALIGVGENDYGHPTSDCLDMLESVGAVPLRTDLHGSIALSISDGSMAAWTERVP